MRAYDLAARNASGNAPSYDARVLERPRWRAAAIATFVCALVAAVAAVTVWPTAPSPVVGLEALRGAHDLDTPRSTTGEDFWALAVEDFDQSLQAARDLQRSWVPFIVPDRWRSGRWFSQGMVLRLRRQHRASRRAFARALAIEPHWAMARVQLARVALKLHDQAGAEKAARQACRDEPDWPAAHLALAHVLEAKVANDDRRGWSRVLTLLRRALALAQDRARPRAYVLADLAQALHVSGNQSAAETAAKEALAIRTDLLAAHLVLAEQALARADGVSAQRHAEAAEALEARDARIELALAEALLLQGQQDAALDRYRYATEIEREDGFTGADPEWMREVQTALREARVPAAYFR